MWSVRDAHVCVCARFASMKRRVNPNKAGANATAGVWTACASGGVWTFMCVCVCVW